METNEYQIPENTQRLIIAQVGNGETDLDTGISAIPLMTSWDLKHKLFDALGSLANQMGKKIRI